MMVQKIKMSKKIRNKAIRKISLEKINQVESHAWMLYAAAQKHKDSSFEKAVSSLILELILAIKGEEDNDKE